MDRGRRVDRGCTHTQSVEGGAGLPGAFVERVNVAGDGDCFYHAVNKTLGECRLKREALITVRGTHSLYKAHGPPAQRVLVLLRSVGWCSGCGAISKLFSQSCLAGATR
jgi:hypothetical protein